MLTGLTNTRHLLGKKSWNVYNQANIEKVRRDEAAAAAREEAEEQRMQEIDAERRMKTLRGLPVEDIPITAEDSASVAQHHESRSTGRERKRRRIAGEDDTDRDMRYAMEERELNHDKAQKALLKSKACDAPLMDRAGHIDLFPAEARKASREQKTRNPEKEAEEAKKKREYEDQYTMRFSNAAGFKQAVDGKPWYHENIGPSDETEAVVSKDVWGNEDPKRRDRTKIRMTTDDPLAAIQKGVQGVRKAEKERKDWSNQRLAEVDDFFGSERKARRHRRHRYDRSEEDDLEGFSLDAPESREQRRKHEHRHRHRRHAERDSRHGHRRSHGSRERQRSCSPRREEKHIERPLEVS